MKKQILNLGKALNKKEQKQVTGGNNLSTNIGDTSNCTCWAFHPIIGQVCVNTKPNGCIPADEPLV